MKELDQKEGDLYYYWTYYDLIESMEVQVVDKWDEENYQGTSIALIKEGRRWGILVFGWGSCSGCDALEACAGNWKEVTELRDELYNQIHWEKSKSAMHKYIVEKDFSLEFYGYSAGINEFVERIKQKTS